MTLLYVIGSLIAVSLLGMGTTAVNLQVAVSGVRWRGFQGLNPVIDVDLLFTNPRRSELRVDAAFVDIGTGGNLLANINAPTLSQTISGGTNSTLTFPVTILLLELPTAIRALIVSGRLPRQIDFSGNIRANGVLIPFRTSYTIPLPNGQPTV